MKSVALLLLILLSPALATEKGAEQQSLRAGRGLNRKRNTNKGKKGKNNGRNRRKNDKKKGSKRGKRTPTRNTKLILSITNESYLQPFSEFFVMVHNDEAVPLFQRGMEASAELSILTEDGDPFQLIQKYKNANGVKYVGSAEFSTEQSITMGGNTTIIEVTVNDKHPLVTIAAMAVNTNDCFVAVNGMPLIPGDILEMPGLDAGSEENNELCESIPGPACDNAEPPERSGNGEGYVHIHRGISREGNLTAKYDWKNPMMTVTVN